MRKISPKWIPAIVAPVVVAVLAGVMPTQASGLANLPAKSVPEIVAMMNVSPTLAFSGELVKTANLGLPALSINSAVSQGMTESMEKFVPEGFEEFLPTDTNPGQLTAALEVLGGTQTARVFAAGPDKLRVQIKDQFSERNLISNGKDAWFYDATAGTVQHATLESATAEELETAKAKALGLLSAATGSLVSTPAELAAELLTQVEKTSVVAVAPSEMVAGRASYVLAVTAQKPGSLIEQMTVAIDGETGLPLRLQVFAKGQEAAAFELGFTSISFEAPAASLFDFKAPASAKLIETELPTKEELKNQPMLDLGFDDLPTVYGAGWSTIVELSADVVPAELADPAVLDKVTNATDGGRVFSTALFNIFIAEDGRVFAGSVELAELKKFAN